MGRSAGIGLAAGITAAAGLIFGRKVTMTAKTGKGHPLKQRVLDAAAAAMQRKHPLDAMSTYLNAFHMYADEMAGRLRRPISASTCALTCTSASSSTATNPMPG